MLWGYEKLGGQCNQSEHVEHSGSGRRCGRARAHGTSEDVQVTWEPTGSLLGNHEKML